MNILSVDSSTDILSVELHTGSARFYEIMDNGLRHSEELLNTIHRVLVRSGLNPKELDLLACTAGPGSFTGLRIGFATIKGLSAGIGKPFVTIPSLDCLAYGFGFFDGIVIPVIDAKKNRVYAALFHQGEKKSSDLDISIPELRSLIMETKNVLFTGPHAEYMKTACAENENWIMYELSVRGNPGALTTLAQLKFQAEGGARSDASPLYIRKSEAEIQTDGFGNDRKPG